MTYGRVSSRTWSAIPTWRGNECRRAGGPPRTHDHRALRVAQQRAVSGEGGERARGAAGAGAPASRPGLPRPALLAALVLSLAVATVEHLLRGDAYWDYSEGVYLFTSRLLLHGSDLYGHTVAAQPPPLFVIGAGLLAIDDSLSWVRAAIGAFQVGTAVLAAAVVWRLVGSRAAAIIAAPLTLLTPWAVHEHGSLIPEMIVAPLLLGGILLARERRLAPWLGVGVALLAGLKLSYALPAVALVAVSADWRRTARWAIGAAGLGIALTLAVFGTDVWRDTVVAQLQSGHVSFKAVAGEWSQVGWHLSGLLIAALLAWRFRQRARDRRALLIAATVAFTTLFTLVSIWKRGTSLNSVIPAEVTIVPLAVAGVAWGLAGGRRALAVIGALGVVFAVAQGVSLITTPYIRGPHLFLRPASSPSYGVTLGKDEVDAAVRDARRCPPGVPYSGTPFIAFVADRRMPADQPDYYLPGIARTLRGVDAAIAADKVRCPAQAPATH